MLYNPFRMKITYEAGHHVYDCYQIFGAVSDEEAPATFDDAAVNALSGWVGTAFGALALQCSDEWNLFGWSASTYNPSGEYWPPPRRVQRAAGQINSPVLPSDSCFNINQFGARPDGKGFTGYLKVSGCPRSTCNAGRVDSANVDAFNAAGGPAFVAPVELFGTQYVPAMKGSYLTDPAIPGVYSDYLEPINQVRLSPVVGMLSARIPNRS